MFIKQLIWLFPFLDYGHTILPIETGCDGSGQCKIASLCQEGWTYNFKRCYKTVSTGASYNEAQSMCSIEKGYLPVIVNSEEHSFLQSPEDGSHVWIGFTDEITEGTFLWDDEHKTSVDTTYWDQGQPAGGGNENCVVSLYNSGWHDVPCANSYYAICEMDLAPRLWYPDKYSMYLFNTAAQTWTAARDSCVDVGAYLLTIGDADEMDLITQLTTNAHWYIGLNDIDSENTFVWLDYGEYSTYLYWYGAEPTNSAGNEDVTIIYNENGWNDVNIDSVYGSICEKGIQWEYFNGKRYFATDYRLTASEAIGRCNSIGGDLAVITSNEENKFLVEMIRNINYLERDFYIGYVSDGDGIWSWPDSSSTVYSNWYEVEGQMVSGCSILHSGQGQWKDVACNSENGFICEAEIPWIPWHDEKYYINTTPMPYDKAREVCQSLGGDLVSYDTTEEEKVITQLMERTSIITTKYKHVYIGNRKENGVFKWARTGKESSVQNWCPGEPSGGSEECTEYLSESDCYNDIICSTHRASICEVDLRPIDGELWEQRRYFVNGVIHENYQSASTKCNEMGMELATISNQYEHDVAVAVMKASGYSAFSVYIGYDDIDTEGHYVWKTGSTRAQAKGFEAWSESSTFGDSYDCTILRASVPDWNSVSCTSTYPYQLCEIVADDDYLFVTDGASNMKENRACVQGHTMKEVQVRSLTECLKVCIDETACLSVNYYSNVIAHGVRNCQLNDVLKSNYPEHVTELQNCSYYEFK